jgi:hypothetical protein
VTTVMAMLSSCCSCVVVHTHTHTHTSVTVVATTRHLQFWNTVRLKGPEMLRFLRPSGMSTARLAEVSLLVSAEQADATQMEDKHRILADIRADYGGTTDRFDIMLRLLLLLVWCTYRHVACLSIAQGDPHTAQVQQQPTLRRLALS